MLNVLALGDELHRLERSDGTPVGWIRDRTIALHGDGGERRALAVIGAAWRALDTALRRQHPGWPRYEPDAERIHLVHDGQHEWVADASRRLARLLRHADAPPDGGGFVLEFDLPSYVTLGTLVAAAQSMSHAVEAALEAALQAAPGVAPQAAPDARRGPA